MSENVIAADPEELSGMIDFVRTTATENVDNAYAEELLEVIRSADGSEASFDQIHTLLNRMFDHQAEQEGFPEGTPWEQIRDTVVSECIQVLRTGGGMDETRIALNQAHQRHVEFIRESFGEPHDE